MTNGDQTTEEDVDEALKEAERVMGLTADEPAFRIECPGCEGLVNVWDEDHLPMGYECFQCAANYEIRAEDEVVLVEKW